MRKLLDSGVDNSCIYYLKVAGIVCRSFQILTRDVALFLFHIITMQYDIQGYVDIGRIDDADSTVDEYPQNNQYIEA